MSTAKDSFVSRNKDIIGIVVAAALILLAPLVHMQFSSDVDWSKEDFAIMGALLFIAGSMYVLFTRLARNKSRTVIGLVIAAAVALIWIELAVGLVGTPFAGS